MRPRLARRRPSTRLSLTESYIPAIICRSPCVCTFSRQLSHMTRLCETWSTPTVTARSAGKRRFTLHSLTVTATSIGVASYGALGHVPPSTYNNLFFSVYFDLYKVWQRLYVDSHLVRTPSILCAPLGTKSWRRLWLQANYSYPSAILAGFLFLLPFVCLFVCLWIEYLKLYRFIFVKFRDRIGGLWTKEKLT